MSTHRDRPPDMSAAARIGGSRKVLLENITGKATPAVYTPRPYAVIITGARQREWGRYPTSKQAEGVAAQLRAHGFDAQTVEAPHA